MKNLLATLVFVFSMGANCLPQAFSSEHQREKDKIYGEFAVVHFSRTQPTSAAFYTIGKAVVGDFSNLAQLAAKDLDFMKDVYVTFRKADPPVDEQNEAIYVRMLRWTHKDGVVGEPYCQLAVCARRKLQPGTRIALENTSRPGWFVNFRGGRNPDSNAVILNQGRQEGVDEFVVVSGKTADSISLESLDKNHKNHYLNYRGGKKNGADALLQSGRQSPEDEFKVQYLPHGLIRLESVARPGYYLNFKGGSGSDWNQVILNEGQQKSEDVWKPWPIR